MPAIERANFGTVASVCREYSGCLPAYGIHPLYVDRAADDDLVALRATLQREPAVAIGEIGLDFYLEGVDRDRQLRFFVAQLELAAEFKLPVLLHSRRAVDAVLAQLRRQHVIGGIAHAFSGSRQQAEAFIALGFKLGFGGTLTYPGSKRIRALAASLPLECLVLETDAPDIPPAWLSEPRRNEPGELERIAEVLAELRGQPLDELLPRIAENSREALPGLVEECGARRP